MAMQETNFWRVYVCIIRREIGIEQKIIWMLFNFGLEMSGLAAEARM